MTIRVPASGRVEVRPPDPSVFGLPGDAEHRVVVGLAI